MAPTYPKPGRKISIHALRGEGDLQSMELQYDAYISIHALRGEGDGIFYLRFRVHDISIHALRGEGDLFLCNGMCRLYHFYPRPPWGGRPGPDLV